MFKRPRAKAGTRRRKSGSATAATMLSAMFGTAARATKLTMKQARQASAVAVKAQKAATAKTAMPAATPRARTAKPVAPVPRARTIPPPTTATFQTALHVCEYGQRRYKIYTPGMAAGSATPLPLLIMLHGCGQTPDDFARGTRMNALAEEFGLLVVYPEQTREAHPKRCWNWFRRGDQDRDAGEPALLASLTRDVLARHRADPARVYVAGLSAGGSAATILAHAYPDLFAAVAVHSGLPAGAAQDKTSALMAMAQGNPGARRTTAIPTIIFHGGDDTVVNPRNGRFAALRALEPFPALRSTELIRQVKGGRSYVKTTHRVGQGRPYVEHWLVRGSGHAWSGGSPAGRFVDPQGPDASREMVRFLLRHRTTVKRRSASPAR